MRSHSTTSKAIGAAAEARAKKYLEEQGLHFVAQNYFCKCGELDLIFKDQETWVFIEVKYRSDPSYGASIEQMSAQKQRRMINAVRVFLLDNQINEFHTPIRIDLVALTDSSIEWLKNVTG